LSELEKLEAVLRALPGDSFAAGHVYRFTEYAAMLDIVAGRLAEEMWYSL
jgi:hypothetical protein